MNVSAQKSYPVDFKKTLQLTFGIEISPIDENEPNEEIEKLWQIYVSGMYSTSTPAPVATANF